MQLFRALKIRNYRLYWSGIFLSQIGSWLQIMGLTHLIYRYTHSEYLLGVMAFCTFIPVLLFSILTGVWIDRIDRPRVLAIVQLLALLQATALAVLTFTQHIQVWHMLGLALCAGFISALDMPLRQTIIGDLIQDRRLLPNAIALNSLQFNIARIIGPAIAGVIILYADEAWCFTLNAMSFIFILQALYRIDWSDLPPPKITNVAIFMMWKDGFRYIIAQFPMRMLLSLLMMTSLTIGTYSALIPALALHLFSGGTATQSMILAFAGLGAILANLGLAAFKGHNHLIYAIAIMGTLASVAYLLLAYTHQHSVGLAIFLLIGAGNITIGASSNTLLQLLAPSARRGQIMSFYVACFVGCYPIGTLIIGWCSEQIGIRSTLLMIGILFLGNMLFFISQLKRLIPEIQQAIKNNQQRQNTVITTTHSVANSAT